MAAPNFIDLGMPLFQSGRGSNFIEEFLSPVLSSSSRYDRLTGYFSVHAFASIAQGLENLIQNNGTIRVVIGLHDVSEEILKACENARDWPVAIIKSLTEDFKSEVGRIRDGILKNRLQTISWMIATGIMQVKVAAPRNRHQLETDRGIFHSKRMIFEDCEQNLLVGVGSQNETWASQNNIEDILFTASWLDSKTALLIQNDFERLWTGERDDVYIVDLTTELSDIFSILAVPPDSDELLSSRIVDFARNSPTFGPFNLTRATLYPHQERVYLDALSRWPVRVMLSDEVGLGKTLEAGVVISYLLRFTNCQSVTVLAPAGLLRQWQEELSHHFSLDFYVWNSQQRTYVNALGDTIQCSSLDTPISQNIPKLRLISSQLARGRIEEVANLEHDVIVVDEAHSARLKSDAYGIRPTKMWNLLNVIKDKTPHLLLLTATPIQIDPIEYHGLLQILGLPESWSDYETYLKSLYLLANEDETPDLQSASLIGKLIISTIETFKWVPENTSDSLLELFVAFSEMDDLSSIQRAVFVRQNWDDVLKLFALVHPAHLLTIRNTKNQLEEFGYVFPKRRFSAPVIQPTGMILNFVEIVGQYLSTGYGQVEAALKPEDNVSLGFAKNGYYQRLVSSLTAAEKTIERRKSKLRSLEVALDNLSEHPEPDDLTFEDSVENLAEDSEENLSVNPALVKKLDGRQRQNLRAAISVESLYLDQLLLLLSGLPGSVPQNDPKYLVARDVLLRLLDQGPVLVFSRYTDTLSGFVDLVRNDNPEIASQGIALYTGPEVWIEKNGLRTESDKNKVKEALDNGEILVVFCSDAASEGLNLQSARSLINLDVPWNPARLEQRIGRIARLGQKAEVVDIVNLWYPKTVESRMYQRLLERHDLYELAVGEFPEIFSEAIANEVQIEFGGDIKRRAPNVEGTLQESRRSIQRTALKKVWNPNHGYQTFSDEFLSDLASLASLAEFELNKSKGSVNLSKDRVTLLDNRLNSLANLRKARIFGIRHDSTCLALAVEQQESRLSVVKCERLPKLLSFVAGESSLASDDFVVENVQLRDLKDWWPLVLENLRWLPNHEHARTMVDDQSHRAPIYMSHEKVSVGFLT